MRIKILFKNEEIKANITINRVNNNNNNKKYDYIDTGAILANFSLFLLSRLPLETGVSPYGLFFVHLLPCLNLVI